MFHMIPSQHQLYKGFFKGPLIKVKFECRKCLTSKIDQMSVDRIKPVSYLFQMVSEMLRSYDRLLREKPDNQHRCLCKISCTRCLHFKIFKWNKLITFHIPFFITLYNRVMNR